MSGKTALWIVTLAYLACLILGLLFNSKIF